MADALLRRLEGVRYEDLGIRSPIKGIFRRFDNKELTCSTREVIVEDLLPLCERGELAIDAGELMDILYFCEGQATEKLERGAGTNPNGLNHSYVTIIYLYTAQFQVSSSFYDEINRLLREENREALKPLARILWLLMWALSYCPPYDGRLVFRGLKLNVAAMYAIGEKIRWHQFSSCSYDITVQKEFTGTGGERTLFNIELTTRRARVISGFSFFPNEREALLPANSCFRVVGNANLGNGLNQIQLRELEPDDPILVFGTATATATATTNAATTPKKRPCFSWIYYFLVPLLLLLVAALIAVKNPSSPLHMDEATLLLIGKRFPNLNTFFAATKVNGSMPALTASADAQGSSVKTADVIQEDYHGTEARQEEEEDSTKIGMWYMQALSGSKTALESLRRQAESTPVNFGVCLAGAYLVIYMSQGNNRVTMPESSAEEFNRCIDQLRDLAAAGSKHGQYCVGSFHQFGIATVVNGTEAMYWNRLAADQGYAVAQYNLGNRYYAGDGVAKDYAEAVRWWQLAADQGFAVAQGLLGVHYSDAKRTGKDYEEAVRWYRLAAEQGQANSQFNLGNCYANGEGVTKDYSKAVYWYRLAADQGHANSQYNLGNRYYNGEGVSKDYVEAARWYRLAADQGQSWAPINLGKCYYNGEGVAKDYAEAVRWWQMAADQGKAVAQSNLGTCYYLGNGVAKDFAKAVRWYRRAADQGFADAQSGLGDCYANGQGVTQDYAKAVHWYRLAADQGNVNAQHNLGNLYYNGQGVAQYYAEAARWYRLAAKQGHANAQINLGKCYYNGEGVTKDYVAAVRWWRKAADQGKMTAQSNLGTCYYLGNGVAKDNVKAVHWWRLAADQGFADAQFRLGECYSSGEGVAKDYAEAVRWWGLAADQGFAEAQNRMRSFVDVRHKA